MSPKNPTLSIIVATFHAPVLLKRAVESVFAQTCTDWELIISSDDGMDYRSWENQDSRIKVVPSESVQSGPGATRNRGLDSASGDYVATLDDDDMFPTNFVEVVLSGLKSSNIVVAPTTYILDNHVSVREIGTQLDYIDIATFGRQLGSLYPIVPREICPRWEKWFAQDVVHACEVIDIAGGKVKVLPGTRYYNILRAGSVCAVHQHIGQEYDAIINRMTDDRFKHMLPESLNAMRELFQYRRAMNTLFEQRQNKTDGYHDFVKKLVQRRSF